MNENTIRYPLPPAERLDEAVRANPTNALLIAAGIGFGMALLLKASHPRTPVTRVQSILEDLEDSLRSAAKPAARHASSLAESGSQILVRARDEMESAVARAIRDGNFDSSILIQF